MQLFTEAKIQYDTFKGVFFIINDMSIILAVCSARHFQHIKIVISSLLFYK